MRRLLRIAILCGVLAMMLCIGAAATDASGMYFEATDSKTTMSALKANGDAATGKETVTISAANKTIYTDAAKVHVTYKGAQNGEYRLILALTADAGSPPTASQIKYIDQATASGNTVEFDVYPDLTENKVDATYTVKISTPSSGLVELGTISYAKDKEIVPYVSGDANGDGKVKVGDATLVLRYCAELIGDGDLNLAAVDVNGDGKVKVGDATLILRYCAELITEFPN